METVDGASSLCFNEPPGACGAQQSLGTLQRELASEQAYLAWRLVRGGWHLHICILAPEVMLMSTAIASCTGRKKMEINQLLAERGREYASREAETKK